MGDVEIRELGVGAIVPSRWQYRRRFDEESLLELAKSIRVHGVVSRMLVFVDEDGSYELIAGERRLRAAQALQLVRNGQCSKLADAVAMVAARDWWSRAEYLVESGSGCEMRLVPVEVREGMAEDYREIVILENLQREDPTAIEEAEGFRVLLEEEGYSQAKLGKRLGKSQGYISQRMGLLDLAEGAREAVESGDVSFTAARAIATLPATVQEAVTTQVQQMARIEGDGQATTRKVQAMTGQIRRFLNPKGWEPNSFNRVLSPTRRNLLRLIQREIRELDEARAGEVILALRNVSKYGQGYNFTGKKPLSIAGTGDDARQVLDVLTGQTYGGRGERDHWQRAARAEGWTCEACRFSKARQPVAVSVDLACARWEGEEAETCLGFIGDEDPVVAVFGDWGAKNWVRKLKIEVLDADGLLYVEDLETYTSIVEQIAEAALADADEKDEEAEHGHLVDLKSYWEAQQDVGESGLDVVHFQAHACVRCVHCRPELMDQDLPPCRFAVEPLRVSRWNDGTAAPGMGVLVGREGKMVPRCKQFRVREVPQLVPVWGFAVAKGERHFVLDWLRGVTKRGSYNLGSVPGVLAWLPWERKEVEENHDVDRMVRYVRENWEALGGDKAVARLVSVALSESRATLASSGMVKLMNPTTGHEEAWRGITWKMFVAGADVGRWSDWPDDWPRPWMKRGEEVDKD